MNDLTTASEIINWLKAHLAEKRPGKTATALAQAMGRDRSVVSKILAAEREVSATELAIMRQFFEGANEAAGSQATKVAITGGVRIVGRIGENLWVKRDEGPLNLDPVGAVSTSYPLQDQSAFVIVDALDSEDFRSGDTVYTVPFEQYRSRPILDECYVVASENSGFVRYGLCRCVASANGAKLRNLGGGADFQGGRSETIVGPVIGIYRPFSTK